MSPKTPRADARLQEWITARQRHHLSHAHVQMARELGMNPRKLGKLDNADQEPWKLPLPGARQPGGGVRSRPDRRLAAAAWQAGKHTR